jgi:hypothetical protein
MKFYVNDNEIDLTLENEKTVGEILSAFEVECEKNDATIVNITIDEKNIPADKIDDIYPTLLENINSISLQTIAKNDIIQALKQLASKFELFFQQIEQIPVQLQSSEGNKAIQTVTQFTEYFDILCHLISLCTLFPSLFSSFTIDGKDLNFFLKDFSPLLIDFENALKDQDTVLIGDLAEYEILPRLQNFVKATAIL